MKKILVAFTTNAGSTEEVAQSIGESLRWQGHQVDVARLEQIASVKPYEVVVVGAPMILGWSRPALRFLKAHRDDLAQRRVAYFCTLMSLTSAGLDQPGPAPLYIDPWLPKPPRNPARLGIKERYAALPNYLRPLFKAAPGVRPLSVAFFGGKLELFRLKWWQMLFVMLVIRAQPGDLRNWQFIEGWAAAADLAGEGATARSSP